MYLVTIRGKSFFVEEKKRGFIFKHKEFFFSSADEKIKFCKVLAVTREKDENRVKFNRKVRLNDFKKGAHIYYQYGPLKRVSDPIEDFQLVQEELPKEKVRRAA